MKKYFFLKKAEDCLTRIGCKVTRWAMSDSNNTDNAIERLRNVKNPGLYIIDRIYEELTRLEQVVKNDDKRGIRRSILADIAMYAIILIVIDDDTK